VSKKRLEKMSTAPMSDDPEDGTWEDFDCKAETGSFTIIADVLPLEVPPESKDVENSERRTLNNKFAFQPHAPPAVVRKHGTSGETTRRRTLDDMRRLSEEIKRKRPSGD
jgi:hypothetical protein